VSNGLSVTGSGSLDRRKVGSGGRAAKMNKIEKNLYLGNMEAATDVILLESHEITHVITLDTIPLPRKMSSFLPRISNMHLNVTDLEDEDILSHIDVAVNFIREAISKGGNVLVHCFRQGNRQIECAYWRKQGGLDRQ
jgi:protein-tyrosine phosphatase